MFVLIVAAFIYVASYHFSGRPLVAPNKQICLSKQYLVRQACCRCIYSIDVGLEEILPITPCILMKTSDAMTPTYSLSGPRNLLLNGTPKGKRPRGLEGCLQ